MKVLLTKEDCLNMIIIKIAIFIKSGIFFTIKNKLNKGAITNNIIGKIF
jgi:hypothetical protein